MSFLQGAGEAAIGIAQLIASAVEKREGIPYSEAIKKVWLKDSRGLIVRGRPEGGISEHKAPFAHERAPMKDLAEIVRDLRPTCLVSLGTYRILIIWDYFCDWSWSLDYCTELLMPFQIL